LRVARAEVFRSRVEVLVVERLVVELDHVLLVGLELLRLRGTRRERECGCRQNEDLLHASLPLGLTTSVLVDRVADEVAVRGELVVEAARSIVVQPRMPVDARPALLLHLVPQPRDQPLADAGRTLRWIDEEVSQIARRRE